MPTITAIVKRIPGFWHLPRCFQECPSEDHSWRNPHWIQRCCATTGWSPTYSVCLQGPGEGGGCPAHQSHKGARLAWEEPIGLSLTPQHTGLPWSRCRTIFCGRLTRAAECSWFSWTSLRPSTPLTMTSCWDAWRRVWGLSGLALHWMDSYLRSRSQSVTIDGKTADAQCLKYGVPQGSVLGPIPFTIYTIPIGHIARKYDLELHLYADDTQQYVSFRIKSPTIQWKVLSTLQACVAELRVWMAANKLCLNDAKTEFLTLCAPWHRSSV